MRICVHFFSNKVLTGHRTETHTKIPVQKAFGGGPSEPPFTSCETRHADELKQERAPGTFLEGAAASVAERVLEELLNEARMVHGRGRVDKRDLPAEQGKGVNAKETMESNYIPEEGLPRD